MSKRYLVVVQGVPGWTEWICTAALSPDPAQTGRMKANPKGKEAETQFRVLQSRRGQSLIEARPRTGRTHQIRVHLLEAGHPVVGDDLYGPPGRPPAGGSRGFPLGLRAVELSYTDPFRRVAVHIRAPEEAFLQSFRFTDVHGAHHHP